MAVLKRLSKAEIKGTYEYYGLMYGIVPVYIGDPNGEARVCVRNWWPDWLLDLADALFGLLVMMARVVKPDFEPMFFFKLTDRIR
ncbi:hypothetical protein [Pseudoalteromonas sp. R3]|uniref:hypothetical protein n=1 Tax=Pseudoalteromonas sp. R3 TaxID=1709477 RepID=UPI0006B4C712|nr:hypothetical protein [Pseudoalteromonas sp. R3]AZZ98780.1 hypothetical protein ELR70_17740 [Pseudoalteromonas sp. R3]